jgi:hypothetical protein
MPRRIFRSVILLLRRDQPDAFLRLHEVERTGSLTTCNPKRWPKSCNSRSRSMGRPTTRSSWEPKQASLYKTIFPQMTNWLPEDEAAQLRFDFESELARLNAA